MPYCIDSRDNKQDRCDGPEQEGQKIKSVHFLIDIYGQERLHIAEETEIESSSYESALKSDFNFFYLRVKDKTERKINFEKYENDVSLKGEFIRLVKESSDLSDEEKSKIIMTGIKALAGRLN